MLLTFTSKNDIIRVGGSVNVMFTWRDIPNFTFKVQVQVLVRSANCSYDTLKRLARDIYTRYVKNQDFNRALQSYMDVCYTIDGIKVNSIGKNASTNRSNMLMQAVAAYFATEMDKGEKNMATLKTYIDLSASGTGTETWFYSKFSSLENFVREVNRVEWLASQLFVHPTLGQEAKDMIEEHSIQAAKDATNMINELAILRKYGVKNSFFQDGMLHDPSQAWVFMDFCEIRELIPGWTEFISPQFAFIGLSDKESLIQIGAKATERVVGISRFVGAEISFPAHVFMTLDIKGEMDASYGLGLMPVRQFFERRNNVALYEYLRFTQALRLYDLVVPITTVEKMPKPPIAVGVLDRIKNILKKKHFLNLDLFIPRIRSLENVDLLLQELEEEIEKADADTTKRSREISRHEVIWHIRRLPQGKKATPESRKRAEEHGIMLADNETYVRPHERGKGQLKEVAHRAKTRR